MEGVFAALLLLGGCGADETARDPDAPVVVAPEEVQLLAAPEDVARVLDMEVAGDGRVWVLNSIEPFFVVVAPDGHVERTFGAAGDGPGEYGFPVGLVRGPASGEMWAYDVPRHALRRVGPEAGPDLHLPSDSLAPSSLVSFQGAGFRPASPWLAPAAGGILLARGRPSAEPWTGLRLWKADVLLVRTDGSTPMVQPGQPVADLLGDPASRWPRATLFLPYPVWSVCGDGGLALYDPLANALRRFTPGGDEREPISLPDERRVALTFDRFYGMFNLQYQQEVPASQRADSTEMRDLFRSQFSQLTAMSADVFPEYADLRCAGDGTLWLEPFDTESPGLGRGPEWWRFEGDGSRTIVRLPEGFTAFRFSEDRVWGASVDSRGIPSVAWIAVGH
jgi:hypothetical protein